MKCTIEDCASKIDSSHASQCFSMVDYSSVTCIECGTAPDGGQSVCLNGVTNAGNNPCTIDDCTSETWSTSSVFQCLRMVDYSSAACAECGSLPALPAEFQSTCMGIGQDAGMKCTMDDCASKIDSSHADQCLGMVDFTSAPCALCGSLPENIEKVKIGKGKKNNNFKTTCLDQCAAWNPMSGCCRERVPGAPKRKRYLNHHDSMISKTIVGGTMAAATAECKEACENEEKCIAVEVHASKKTRNSKNKKKKKSSKGFKCELHTAKINSSSRKSKSCKKAKCFTLGN